VGEPCRNNQRDAALLAVLGRNIAALIKKRGFESQELFACEIDLPKTTLSRIIRGTGDVRISKLAKIAKALKVKVDDLLKP
jgi:transcriptional regulator with XRE-family HTH domain